MMYNVHTYIVQYFPGEIVLMLILEVRRTKRESNSGPVRSENGCLATKKTNKKHGYCYGGEIFQKYVYEVRILIYKMGDFV